MRFNGSSLKAYKAPWFQQFRAVLWRSWHSVTKDPIIARIRIIEAIVRRSKLNIPYLISQKAEIGNST